MRKPSRHIEAFKESYNTVGLAAAAALSAATLNPLPLLAGLVAEAAYLLFVPDTKWYEARLSRRYDAEVEQRRQQVKDQILPTLRPEVQARFARLEETRRQIDANAQADRAWFREVLRKLDYLLEKFLLFASKEVEFRNHLKSRRDEIRGGQARNEADFDLSDRLFKARRADRPREEPKKRPPSPNNAERETPPLPADPEDRWVALVIEEVRAHYEKEREGLEQLLQSEESYDTQSVLQKRMEVLQRRHEFVGKIGKILININHQLQLVEDTFGLINDEIRARSPEQILSDIEEVVLATNTMSSALEELASYEQLATRLSA